MSTFRGFPACECLAEWLPVFEATISRSPHWFQLIGDAPASAGFHRGGGSADSEPLSADELRIARNMGAAAWNRWWRDSDGDPNYHAHLRLNGCSHNTVAQPQVADLNAGRDGTGPLYDNAGAPDDGPRDGVHWPLRTWREGIAWAIEMRDDMPAPKDWDDRDWAAFNKNVAPGLVEAVLSAQIETPKGKRSVSQVLKELWNKRNV